jgi:hypothetical protein
MIRQSKLEEARQLSDQVGVPVHTARHWIHGTASPDQTIKMWVMDHFLDMMRIQQKPGETFTLQEIADRVGVTKERIRQIEFEALKKVRKNLDDIIREIEQS